MAFYIIYPSHGDHTAAAMPVAAANWNWDQDITHSASASNNTLSYSGSS